MATRTSKQRGDDTATEVGGSNRAEYPWSAWSATGPIDSVQALRANLNRFHYPAMVGPAPKRKSSDPVMDSRLYALLDGDSALHQFGPTGLQIARTEEKSLPQNLRDSLEALRDADVNVEREFAGTFADFERDKAELRNIENKLSALRQDNLTPVAELAEKERHLNDQFRIASDRVARGRAVEDELRVFELEPKVAHLRRELARLVTDLEKAKSETLRKLRQILDPVFVDGPPPSSGYFSDTRRAHGPEIAQHGKKVAEQRAERERLGCELRGVEASLNPLAARVSRRRAQERLKRREELMAELRLPLHEATESVR